MKQRITAEQLNELTDVGRRKLHSHHTFKKGDWVMTIRPHGITGGSEWLLTDDTWKFFIHDMPEYTFPLLSIGQMIEFLGDDYCDALMRVNNWELEETTKADEVCDGLWELVKSGLEA
jgi:hypothetical protein